MTTKTKTNPAHLIPFRRAEHMEGWKRANCASCEHRVDCPMERALQRKGNTTRALPAVVAEEYRKRMGGGQHCNEYSADDAEILRRMDAVKVLGKATMIQLAGGRVYEKAWGEDAHRIGGEEAQRDTSTAKNAPGAS